MSTTAGEIIEQWPEQSREAAQLVVDTYGEPRESTDTLLIWNDVGPWKRVLASRTYYEHHFPIPHIDSVESVIDYQVPPEKFTALAEFDGSVVVDRTAGEVSARCHDEQANLLALNLMDDIVRGEDPSVYGDGRDPRRCHTQESMRDIPCRVLFPTRRFNFAEFWSAYEDGVCRARNGKLGITAPTPHMLARGRSCASYARTAASSTASTPDAMSSILMSLYITSASSSRRRIGRSMCSKLTDSDTRTSRPA